MALESYYVGKEREVNENICKALDVAEITLADTTLNFSAAHVNFSFNAKPAAPEKTRYSVSIFDQIEVQPQQRRSKVQYPKAITHSIINFSYILFLFPL